VLEASGRKAAEFEAPDAFSTIGVDWCFDLEGDGVQELSVYRYSGGAHCCITQSVYSLGPRITKLFDLDAGNAGGLGPAELDGREPYELVGVDDRFANFANLPFAVSPYVALVMAKRGEEWVVATAEFPNVVRGHRDETIKQAPVCEREGTPECWRGLGVGIMADSLVIGDWETVRHTLSLPEDTLFWLELQRDAIQAKLAEPK
jgi:hypothetical protein